MRSVRAVVAKVSDALKQSGSGYHPSYSSSSSLSPSIDSTSNSSSPESILATTTIAAQSKRNFIRKPARASGPCLPTTWQVPAHYVPIRGLDLNLSRGKNPRGADTKVALDFIEKYKGNIPKLPLVAHVVKFTGFHTKCQEPTIWSELARIFAVSLTKEIEALKLRGLTEPVLPDSGPVGFTGIFGEPEKEPFFEARKRLRPPKKAQRYHIRRQYPTILNRKFPLGKRPIFQPITKPWKLAEKQEGNALTDYQQLRLNASEMGQNVALASECFRVNEVSDEEMWEKVARLAHLLINTQLLDFTSGSRYYLALASAGFNDPEFWRLIARSLRGDYPMESIRRTADIERILNGMKVRHELGSSIFSDVHSAELFEELQFMLDNPFPDLRQYNLRTKPRLLSRLTLQDMLQEDLDAETIQDIKPEVVSYCEEKRFQSNRQM